MENAPLWLPVIFFVIALLYSMVGFAGGSAYLAVLALMKLPHESIPQIALICNLVVSAGGVWFFHRSGHLVFKKFLPFIALSVPMAYLGGRIPVSQRVFMLVLGAALLAAGARMLFSKNGGDAVKTITNRQAWTIGLPVGAGLGLLAGMVGFGAGILLAPVLLLTGLASAKETAGAAALFILVNSFAGMAGHLAKGLQVDVMIVPLAVAAVLGGQLGSRLGAYHMPTGGLRRMLAALIVIVSLRILWQAI